MEKSWETGLSDGERRGDEAAMSVLFPPYLCVCVDVCVCVCVGELVSLFYCSRYVFCLFFYVLYICVVCGPHAGRGLAALPLFI